MAWLFSEYEKNIRDNGIDPVVHKKYIHWLQHERLLHLLVTLTTGLATLMIFLTALITQEILLAGAGAISGLLFIGYLIYYRKLENTVQRWYKL
jgi:hypothetical protein